MGVQIEADGRSPHTIGQYRRHVTAFATWLAHGGPRRAVTTIGHGDVAAFLAASVARTAAHGGPKKAISMNAMRTSLRCFFRYLHEAGALPQNPARLVRRATCAPPPPRAFADPERDRLLATLRAAAGFEGERDYLLVDLLLGIRLGSCIALDIEDVDLAAGELRLKSTKGDRPERVFLAKGISGTDRSPRRGLREDQRGERPGGAGVITSRREASCTIWNDDTGHGSRGEAAWAREHRRVRTRALSKARGSRRPPVTKRTRVEIVAALLLSALGEVVLAVLSYVQSWEFFGYPIFLWAAVSMLVPALWLMRPRKRGAESNEKRP